MKLNLMHSGSPAVKAPGVRVKRSGDQIWYGAIRGERHTMIVSAREADGAFSIVEAVVEPGAAIPFHAHNGVETYRILEGVLTLAIDDDVLEAPAGATVSVPARVTHAWKNRSARPVRMLVVFVPGADVDEMFAAADGASSDGITGQVDARAPVVAPPIGA